MLRRVASSRKQFRLAAAAAWSQAGEASQQPGGGAAAPISTLSRAAGPECGFGMGGPASLWSPAAGRCAWRAAAGGPRAHGRIPHYCAPSAMAMAPPPPRPLNGSRGIGAAAGRSLACRAASEASAGPALPEGFNMEVTRDNFFATLPVMEHAIQECDFVSVDLEMTGLALASSSMHYLDEMQDRYSEVSESARRFLPMQLGVSCFTRKQVQGADGGAGGLFYEAKSFCIYLFPLSSADHNPRFECEAKSLAFMASCGFDFNKCFANGVPFLPLTKRDAKLANVGRHAARKIPVNSPSSSEYVGQLVGKVSRWLAGSDPVLQLPPFSPHTKALQLQELAKPQFRAVDPPGFYIEEVKSDGRDAHRLVRASSREVKAYNNAKLQKRVEAIHDLAGASRLFEVLKQTGKPLVGHNPLYDMLFILEHFAAGLPHDYNKFKRMARDWFPGGVYDTKFISGSLPGITQGDTGLQKVFRIFSAGLVGDAPPVDIRHAPGFERYKGLEGLDIEESMEFAHEAGFDAFMTGSVFANCYERIKSKSGVRSDVSSSSTDKEGFSLLHMEPFLGRLHIAYSDHSAMHLWGSDIQPKRQHVLYICNIGRHDKKQDVVAACRDAGMRNFNVELLPRMNIATVTLSRKSSSGEGWKPASIENLRRQVISNRKGWAVKTAEEHRQHMEELQHPAARTQQMASSHDADEKGAAGMVTDTEAATLPLLKRPKAEGRESLSEDDEDDEDDEGSTSSMA